MGDILKNTLNNLLSRSFIVLLLSIWLYVAKYIDMNFFCVLNGFNYAGSGIKGLLDNASQPKTSETEVKK